MSENSQQEKQTYDYVEHGTTKGESNHKIEG